ncbi:uncharacterized protein Dwil_GK16039 [Drosophila willistoni]|uniref:Uncharacterized protein n=1 Tax=Drosophila willistoni TaxID=7260 RepID=B4NQ17_DROWI|nr:cytochrome P450 4d2 [Drosophila willistoni]EDW86242.1 uncharacterized protein Dwil_GK16039 [Drosophila willistoni]
MLSLALFLVVSAIATLFLWDYLTRKRRNDMLHYMPGPPALPLLGNVLMYRGLKAEQLMDFIQKNRDLYGTMYRVWVLKQLAVFSTDPRDIEIILSSPQHITKNNLYELLHCWLGTGLLMSTGKKWHTRRKIITPAFHFKILEQFVEIFDQQSSILVEQLRKHADGETPINVFPFICLEALDIIAETSMGTRINAQMNPNLPYVQAVTDVTNIMITRFINAWQRIEWLYRLVKPSMAKKQDLAIQTLHKFTDDIIQKRRQALINGPETKTQETNADDVGQKQRMALLDVLLQATVNGQPLSNEDIREEVDTFMFEGHDTTTSAISFCLYEISRDARVQKLLLEEIQDKLSPGKPTTQRDLGELKYLECVIKESLRMHPPVPMIGRWFHEDVEIRGKRIPAGTNFTVGIYFLMRDPLYFDSPNEFRPERFLNDQTTNPYAYIPFSAGPRNCIGQKFAVLEMKSTISKLLQHYELLPLGPDPLPLMNIVLRSVNGVHLGLRPRKIAM